MGSPFKASCRDWKSEAGLDRPPEVVRVLPVLEFFQSLTDGRRCSRPLLPEPIEHGGWVQLSLFMTVFSGLGWFFNPVRSLLVWLGWFGSVSRFERFRLRCSKSRYASVTDDLAIFGNRPCTCTCSCSAVHSGR
jgi:hypothetical protein